MEENSMKGTGSFFRLYLLLSFHLYGVILLMNRTSKTQSYIFWYQLLHIDIWPLRRINPYHICNVTIIEFEYRNQRELSLGGHFICQKTIDLKTTLHLFCWSLNNLSLPTLIVCTSTAVQKGIILIYCYKQDLKRNGW